MRALKRGDLGARRRGGVVALLCGVLLVAACDDDGGTVSRALLSRSYADVSAASVLADTRPVGDSQVLDTQVGDTDAADTQHDDTAVDDTVVADTGPLPDTTPPGPCSAGDGAACAIGGESGRCDGGVCTRTCGDGFIQPSLGETCDDGNERSGDGCRDDCVAEEPIGEGYTGGQCADDLDCAPTGARCIPGVGGGSCSVPCTQFCDDQAGSPVTFCVDATIYESRLGATLPSDLSPALCVSKCDFARFSRTGCRAGLHCELRTRYQSSTEDEVCVPGPWSVGLTLSGDGRSVIGAVGGGPAAAEPYSGLLSARCGASFDPIDAVLFRGLALTLLAMDADGRDQTWERLCSAPGNLPNIYTLRAEAAAGRAFRLSGSRLDVIDWAAAALYGGKAARGVLYGGPLFESRAMVYRNGSTSYLYADAAADRPYDDPERGRHFGVINGDEWAPLDTLVEPDSDYVTVKVDRTHAFYRQWGRLETVEYIADMALDYLFAHGLPLGIGDISLAAGGDISGHSSHETGLDIDIYLLDFDRGVGGQLLTDREQLWVSRCQRSGSSWDCSYYDDRTGDAEDLSVPGHVPAATLLTTLAQYAYDHEGPSHFVQNDVVVLAPFAALPGNTPRYLDATTADAAGWPPHRNHVHIRFSP